MTGQIIQQIRSKDKRAQYQFYAKYSAQLFLIALRYVKCEHVAGDILNTTFFKIFNGLASFNYENEKMLLAWMKKITINESLIYIRNRVKNIEYNDISQNSLSIENDYLTHFEIEEYYNMIRELPDELRTVFNLYAIEGYSHKEIGEKLTIQESSSRVYLMRARKLLIQKLHKN